MSTDLAHVLGMQETASLEFKREATDRQAIRKAICALANDLSGIGGGSLLIGVDSRGAVAAPRPGQGRLAVGVGIPGLILVGPAADGRMSKSKIAVGR